MTIKTLNVPGAVALKSVVAKIRKRCDCGSDPDGYFTYTEIPNKGYGDSYPGALVPSQYFLGESDIKILKGFFTPETGCRNPHEEYDRRKFWWHTMESELFAECELTAPITFWACNECSKWFIRDTAPVWDFSKYGEVSADEFLSSLTVSGGAIFNYRQLSTWWYCSAHDESNRTLSDADFFVSLVMLPWIEQLPYADMFICNEDLYDKTCGYGG